MEKQKLDILLKKAMDTSLLAGEIIMDIYLQSEVAVELKRDQSPLTIADKKSHIQITKMLDDTGLPIISEEGGNISYRNRKKWHYFWLVDPLDGTKEFIQRNGEFTVNIALIKGQGPIAGVVYIPQTKIIYFSAGDKGSYIKRIKSIDTILNSSMHHIYKESTKLPDKNIKKKGFVVVGSRSHMNEETWEFIERIKQKQGKVEIVYRGSALKMCMVAEGKADIYPRFGPTMEWDTAAGQCIATGAGYEVTQIDGKTPLFYNKEELVNPWFIVKPKGYII